MAPEKKKPTISGAERGDPTSDLPTVILAHILSFLPLKLAVRCRAVSKPWFAASLELISHATALDFGEEFADGISPAKYSFAVDSVLAALESPRLDSMKICYNHHGLRRPSIVLLIRSCIKRWVELASSKHVKDLEVKLRGHPVSIPFSAFQSTALTRLSLSNCSFDLPFDALKLPLLQEISLERVDISDGIFDSPDLATVKLIHCVYYGFSDVKISPPSRLRNLMITRCRDNKRIEIEAQTLQSLHLAVYFQEIVLKDVSGLKEVHIELPYDHAKDLLEGHEKEIPDETMHWALLSALRGVTDLTFSGPLLPLPLPAMEIEGFGKLTFVNLKSFRYQIRYLGDEFMGLPNFLHYCNFPVLEQLVTEYICNWKSHHLRHEELPTFVSPLSNLKEVSIQRFCAHGDQMRLVEFLLQRAVSLRTLSLNIDTFMFRASQLPMLQVSIDALPKANRDAKILLQLETSHRFNS